MNLKFTKLSFITGALVVVVGFFLLLSYSLVVYSNYIMYTEGTALSVFSLNKANLNDLHAYVNQSVVDNNVHKQEVLQSKISGVARYNELLTKGGVYTQSDQKQAIAPAKENVLVVMREVENKWKAYQELASKIVAMPLLMEEPSGTLPLDSETEGIASTQKINADLQAKLAELAGLKAELSALYDKGTLAYTDTFMKKQTFVQVGVLISVIICLATFIAMYFQVLRKRITQPLEQISGISKEIAKGDISQPIQLQSSNEIGELASNINQVVHRLRESSAFAAHIGSGQFESDFQPASDKDELGKALLSMRDNLVKVAIEDKKRNWATEGFAMFGDILRSEEGNMEDMAYAIISNLIKYMKANQGSLYVLEEEGEQKWLTLKSCYAYGRKKHIGQQLQIGEGLLGQAVQEKDIIFLTDVPQDYIRITSGLGEANPKCILISPLMVNGEVYGALEIASFKVIDTYEIEFVQKLSETIASTISSVKINERTKMLLHASQQHAEELRSQEEEMRQNLEELSATQENQSRLQEELMAKEEELRQQLMAMEEAKGEIERVRQMEQERANTRVEDQKKAMEKVMAKFKENEQNLKKEITRLTEELSAKS